MYGKGRELELGNATTAILISLLKTLVDKSVLSNTDVRVLLNKAANGLGPHEYARDRCRSPKLFRLLNARPRPFPTSSEYRTHRLNRR